MRFVTSVSFLAGILSWNSIQAAEATFRVAVLDPASFSSGASAADVVPWDVAAPLGPETVPVGVGIYLDSDMPGAEGVQGWSLSVLADDCVSVLDATTNGTVGADVNSDPMGWRNGGFESTEVVDPDVAENGGRQGVVSGVVLAFDSSVSLPPRGEALILRVSVEVDASSLEAIGDRTTRPCLVSPLLRSPWLKGSGRPVETVVTVDGGTVSDLAAIGAAIHLEATESFAGEYRIDLLSSAATRGERVGNTVPWHMGVSPAATTVPLTLAVVIASNFEPEEPGIEAWSFSLEIEECFDLVSATIAGTAADEVPDGKRDDGFESTEIVDPARNGGRHGIVSAVILQFGGGITLDPMSETVVLELTGALDASSIGGVGDRTPPCGIRPVAREPWLRGTGEPVNTLVTVAGTSVLPPALGTIGSAITLEGAIPLFDGEFRVDVASPAATEGARTGSVVDWLVPAPVEEDSVSVWLDVALVSRMAGAEKGPEAWSISLEAEPCFVPTEATTSGTVAADSLLDSAGLRLDGFESTEIVDPDRNDGRLGVVSAAILAFGGAITLPPVSEAVILRVRGDIDASSIDDIGDLSAPCTVRPLTSEPWLRGAGEPVDSLVTVDANALRAPGVGARMTLEARLTPFRRGDANGDGTLNIADGQFILNFLFGSGSVPSCRDAADTDDNGAINLGDGVGVYNFLFSSGRPPAPPGHEVCGTDPTNDALDCPAYDCP